jgi:gliding motility-associated-like protein
MTLHVNTNPALTLTVSPCRNLTGRLSIKTLFAVLFLPFASLCFAQGPNPQTGMRVTGNINLSSSCEEDTLEMENLTKDSAKTVKYYVHDYNYFNNPFYKTYRDTFYTKVNGAHKYIFDDSTVMAHCYRSVNLYFGIIAYDTFGVDYPVISRITIFLRPRALFTIDSVKCAGDRLKLKNLSCKDSTKFKWFFDDTFSTLEEPIIFFDSSGKKTVKFIANTTHPCALSDTLSHTVNILKVPEPGFRIVNTSFGLFTDSVICIGDTLYLINTSKYNDSINYKISPPGCFALLGGTKLYEDTVKLLMQNKGDVTIEQEVFNKACNRTKARKLHLIQSPVISLKPLPDCIDSFRLDLNQFVDTSNGAPERVTWNIMGNGLHITMDTLYPGMIGSLSYGKYIISARSVGVCRTVTSADSFFVAPPVRSPDPFSICYGTDLVINLNKLIITPGGFKRKWSGAVTNDSLFTTKGKAAGNYTLTLTDLNSGCYQPMVKIEILGGASKVPDQHLCSKAPAVLALDPLIQAAFTGTGVARDTFYPALSGAGKFNISYTTVFKTCVFTDSLKIFVHDTFTPVFSFITPGCKDSAVTFKKVTAEKTIRWDFGDGASSTLDEPAHIFKNTGNYMVRLIAGTYCPDTLAKPLTIYPGPQAILKVVIDSLGCDSAKVLAYFINKGYGEKYMVIHNAKNYPGDSVRFTFAKSFQAYNIALTGIATSKCGSNTSILSAVRVPQRNYAALEILGFNPGCHGDSLKLVNASYGPVDSFTIDYGNGRVSRDKVLKLPFYNNSATLKEYKVILTVHTKYCGVLKDTASYKVMPNVIKAAGEHNKEVLCNYEMVTFINNCTQGTEFNLFFGDGGSKKGTTYHESVDYKYLIPGVYIPYIKAISACGTDSVMMDTIRVNGAPAVFLSNARPKMCLGSEIFLKYSPSSLLNPKWFVNHQLVDSLVNPFKFHPQALGKYKITVLAENQFCTGLDSFEINVEDAPAINIDVTEVTCDTVHVEINGNYKPGKLEVNWGDGITDFGKLYHVYLDTGVFLVKIVLVEGLCTLYFEREVIVKMAPRFKVNTEPRLDECLNPGDILNIAIELDSLPYQVDLYDWAGKQMCLDCERRMRDVKYMICQPKQFKVVVRDKDNCRTAQQLSFACFDPGVNRYKAYVPNAFTPKNGDVLNDIYKPYLAYYDAGMDYNLKIFNRWGEKVFETTDPAEGWDGTYKGELCQMDVYVYVIEYGCPEHKYNGHRGTFHLIK